nr:hypothetical protein [Bifidobacterium simiiventris]
MQLAYLDGHRFIAITNSGQTLDGWLKHHPNMRSCYDLDCQFHLLYELCGVNRLGSDIKAINVLDEVRR